jgi:hypothetical protein
MKPIIFTVLLFFPLLALSESSLKSGEDKAFLTNYRIALDISSFGVSTRDDERTFDWSLSVENKEQEQAEFELTFANQNAESTDAFDGSKVKTMNVELNIDYETNRTWGNWGYDSHLFYEREKENELYIVKHNVEVSPIGIKYDFFETRSFKELSLSYLPTYSYYASEDRDVDGFGKVTTDTFLQKSFMHLIQLKYEDRWFKNLNTRLDLEWRSMHTISKSVGFLDRKNVFKSNFEISYAISDQLSFGYLTSLEKSKQRQSFQQLPETIVEHTLFLSWRFN